MMGKIIDTSIKGAFFLLTVLIVAGGFLTTACAADKGFLSPEKIYYPALEFDLPQTQRLVLENGIVIYYLPDHELPLINISVLVKTGTVYDPEGKEGVAELTAYVMRIGGTKHLQSDEVDRRLDFLAAIAAISIARDGGQVDFSVLNKDLDEGLDLLSQMLIHPAFEQKKFDLALQLKKEDLRRLKDNPQRLAFREFNRLIYRDDPWGRFPSQQSLTNIERADLIQFHRRFFQPQNMIFAVTGDITKTQVIDKFRQYFGSWKKGETLTDIPKPSQKTTAGVYCLHKDIPQSTIISGQFAPSKTDPDYYTMSVLDFIAGSGGFASRIVSAVRNSAGLAYSSGSYYRARPDFGVIGAYAFTKTASTMKTISLINAVLDDLQTGAITDEELDWAKKSINNGFIFSFTTPDKILWQQIHIEYEKLPADFLINYRSKIASVDLIDLNRVAAKYLDKQNNVVLILGNSKNFDEPADKSARPVLITFPD